MPGGRYIRQEVLGEIGAVGQKKLADAKVCIVGCGGLGSIAAPYLAGAGIGHLTLIDGDVTEQSNLHRQVFFTPLDDGTKAQVLAEHITRFNPEIQVTVAPEMLSKDNVVSLLAEADLVLECTDDILCKYLVNDWCHLHKVPLIYGAIFKFEGYVSLFENTSFDSIHLRDAFPIPDVTVPSCSEVGVMNTIAGLIGLLQANEAIKYILGLETLAGNLLTYNCLTNEQLKLKLKKAWKGDIAMTYTSETYLMTACEVSKEVDTETLIEDPSMYNIVSILEKGEHRSISKDTVHVPLSGFVVEEWESYIIDASKPTLLYCRMGRRSNVLVEQIIKASPNAKVYSLLGGLTTYREEC